jgi:ankyrin repeat protein
MSKLTASELAELQVVFEHVTNYENEDPTAPISPLTYVAPDGDTCLHIAAHKGHARAVELLIKAGLEVNRQGDMGYTPLHYAANQEVVSLLLAAGASTTIENQFGKSPIGWQDASSC